MKSILSFYLLLLLACLCLLADSPVVGKWDCLGTSNGNKIPATLNVREDSGKITGTLTTGEGADLALVDPKVENGRFTFKLMINGDAYAVDLKLDGNKMTGTYTGPDASGDFEATKK
jgi:hypothetical protein